MVVVVAGQDIYLLIMGGVVVVGVLMLVGRVQTVLSVSDSVEG